MYDIQVYKAKEINTYQRYSTTNPLVYDDTATLALHSAVEKTETNSEGEPHNSRQYS